MDLINGKLALEAIFDGLSLEKRVKLANLSKDDLRTDPLAIDISFQFNMWDLINGFDEEKSDTVEDENQHVSFDTQEMILKLWERLKRTYKLRVIK